MRHRNKVLRQGPWYQLIKNTNPKTGRHHYIISVNLYTISGSTKNGQIRDLELVPNLDLVREHFDPQLSRGGRWATKWKYRNRADAEKLLTMALLKFGG